MLLKRVRLFAILTGVLLSAPMSADAQPKTQVAVVGFLSGERVPSAPDWKQRSPFFQALGDLGWREGQNLSVESRWADGRLERLPELAAELVNLKVDVLVAGAFRPGQAAGQATKSIPVVLITCDPYQWLVESLARPGGNITGQTCLSSEMSPKKLEFLKAAAPRSSRVAFLYNPDDPGPSLGLKLSQEAAPSLGMKVFPVAIRRSADLDAALAAIKREQPDALFVYPDSVTASVRPQTIEFASKQRLPAVYGFKPWPEAGGLLSYGASLPDMSRRAAGQVDKILKGTKPADLPFEQPTRFRLALNLKTAQALGLPIPPILLFQADEVIR